MKRFWKWLGGTCLVGLGFGFLWVLQLYLNATLARVEGEKRLTEVMAELDATEPSWRFEDFFATRNQGLAPPEKNAAYRLHKVFSGLPADFLQPIRKAPPELFEETPSNQLLLKQSLRDIRAILDANRHVLDGIHESVSDLDRSGFVLVPLEPNPMDTLLKERQDLRQLGAFPRLALFSCLDNGDAKGAIRCAKMITGIGLSLGDEPFLIVQLIKLDFCRVACSMTERILASSVSADADLGSLQADLERALQQEFMQPALRGERVLADKLMQSLQNGRCSLVEISAEKDGPKNDGLYTRVIWAINRGYVPEQRALSLEWLTTLIHATDVPYPERRDRYMDYVNAFKGVKSPRLCFLCLIIPALDQVSFAEQRVKTLLGTAVVAIACERFRLQNQRWPTVLEEIPMAILPEVPNDLFTGLPLMMKRTDTGLVIYSTGVDGIDNGGEKLTKGMIEGTDYGIRLYDPQHRRQKAAE